MTVDQKNAGLLGGSPRLPLLLCKAALLAAALGCHAALALSTWPHCQRIWDQGAVADVVALGSFFMIEIVSAVAVPILRRFSIFAAIVASLCSLLAGAIIATGVGAPSSVNFSPGVALGFHALNALLVVAAVEAAVIPLPPRSAPKPLATQHGGLELFVRDLIRHGASDSPTVTVREGSVFASQRYLAKELGITPSAVARQLKALTKAGVLQVDTAGGLTRISLRD